MYCDVLAAQLVGRQCSRREGFAAEKRIGHDRSVLRHPDIYALHLREWNLAVETAPTTAAWFLSRARRQKAPISAATRQGARLSG
ncbi:hypothetical protein MPRG_20900 [Mycobacterium paragordonae]|uniref:Uncharacterized protein n=1 Tax=Mycobacterium paragordonae TaxID=1389713 RepID=A0ABQ1C326_9MYCO|nr:hypothetical protein MPRG_20900 [Mycobacterium paragordonae]